MQAITLFSDHQNSVKSSLTSRKWHARDNKLNNFPYKVSCLRGSTRALGPRSQLPPPSSNQYKENQTSHDPEKIL
jgi:hypothetical protein